MNSLLFSVSNNFLTKSVAGKVIRLNKASPKLMYFDNFQAVGGKIWPASDTMVQYLAKSIGQNVHSHSVVNRNILELGSGCGYLGISCGVLGAQSVVLTDRLLTQRRKVYDMEGVEIEEESSASTLLLDICQENVMLNTHLSNCKFSIKPLHWGPKYHSDADSLLFSDFNANSNDTVLNTDNGILINKSIDMIVGSDLTYFGEFTRDLFHTVKYIIQSNTPVTANISSSTNKTSPIKFITFQDLTNRTLETAYQYGFTFTVIWNGVMTVDNNNKEEFTIWEFTLQT